MIEARWSLTRFSQVNSWLWLHHWATEIHHSFWKATEAWLLLAIFPCYPRHEKMRWWEGPILCLTMFWCRKKNFVSNKIFACKPDYISCSKKNNINRTISAIGLLLWILTLHNNSCSNTPSHNISNTLIYNSIKQFSKMHQSVSDYHKGPPSRLSMSTIIQLTTLIKEEQSVHKSYSVPTRTNQPRAITTCITTTSHVPFLRSMVITRRRRFKVTVL